MKVRCVKTEINNPSPELESSGWSDAEGYLTLGKEYEVFAFFRSYHGKDIDAYLICDDFYNDMDYNYPLYIPAMFFIITDDSKPSFWITPPDNPRYEGPPELVQEKYEAILDGDPVLIAAFRKLKYKMNGEIED